MRKDYDDGMKSVEWSEVQEQKSGQSHPTKRTNSSVQKWKLFKTLSTSTEVKSSQEWIAQKCIVTKTTKDKETFAYIICHNLKS